MLNDTVNLESECPICYIAHDEDTHQATLRVHRWFSGLVTRSFECAGSPSELETESVA